MRAFQVTGFDTAPQLVETDCPVPGPGQVLVRISACGLNFADLLMMSGRYQDTPAPPFTLGMEIAGTIEALGPGVTGTAPGTRVAVFAGQGGLAEYGVFDAARCVAIPDMMPDTHAAGFLVAYGTSHVALARRARLGQGERLLVLGAGGGVGLTAVELGAGMGAEVIAVARGADKLEAARAAGARHLLDATEVDLRGAVKDLGGADVVYDAVGGDMFTAALRATNPLGRILCIGFASGTVPQIPANHLLVKNIDVIGLYWGGYLKFAPQILTDSLSELMQMYAEGRIAPHIGATRELGAAAEALGLLKDRRVAGKVVVTI
ncbi:Oxidoreductase, zinc-binding protein dehydrogenase family [Roseibacterium elongatum DSM 19469]|uniref:Oxidoreductase, zinc-binding protein dehydrogenase family n=1 Tax=Roseicyclus elongatus DSM 19469 TaxID=1294273 RepID=W8RTD9_9RHOB|nr:NADPH:quinone oxidoreductase family protein [Roseibacterium elongatum]AHM04423.1 Oxidoreductase, zinc-binding protein dehydrogenase family [Roseibacterium elongatum DSM 19469]